MVSRLDVIALRDGEHDGLENEHNVTIITYNDKMKNQQEVHGKKNNNYPPIIPFNGNLFNYYISNTTYTFHSSGIDVHLGNYPPPPVIWMYTIVDTICVPFQCGNWREYYFHYVYPYISNNNKHEQVSYHNTIHSNRELLQDVHLAMNDNIPLTFKSTRIPNDEVTPWFSELNRLPSVWVGNEVRPKLLTYENFLLQQQQSLSTTPVNNNIVGSIRSMYQYCFCTSSTQFGRVTTPPAMVVTFLLFLFLHNIKKKCIIPYFQHRVGTKLAIRCHGSEWLQNVENKQKIFKFGEYCFRLLYHSTLSLYGFLAFRNENWWVFRDNNTFHCFYNYGYQPIPPRMAWYFILQCCYNLDALYSILEMSFVVKIQSPLSPTTTRTDDDYKNSTLSTMWNEMSGLRSPILIQWKDTVRGDFQEMFIHHVVTNFLTIFGSNVHFHRPAILVFFVHDISDIFVDCTKLANFMKWKSITIVSFIFMAIAWFITRLYIYPYHMVYKLFVNRHILMATGFLPQVYLMYRDIMVMAPLLLVGLHIIWFGMFLRIFHTIVYKKQLLDYSVREKNKTE